MNWNKNKSIFLSQICVILFALMLLALDLGGWWWTSWFVLAREMRLVSHVYLLLSLYACSIPAWITLWGLWRLLCNLKANRVFVTDNVAIMRAISRSCLAAAAICLISSLYYLAFLVLALSSAFMALIVRIVQNAFLQAIRMQDELELTI